MRPPTRSSRATADLITSGSVAPIIDVGTISSRNATTKRITVTIASDCGSAGWTAIQTAVSASSRNGVAKAVMPTSASAMPKATSGREMRAASRPPTRLPDAESGHESGEHRAGGVDGDAEHQRQQPQPHHLVDQRARAGAEEEDEQQWQEPPRGGGVYQVTWEGIATRGTRSTVPCRRPRSSRPSASSFRPIASSRSCSASAAR